MAFTVDQANLGSVVGPTSGSVTSFTLTTTQPAASGAIIVVSFGAFTGTTANTGYTISGGGLTWSVPVVTTLVTSTDCAMIGWASAPSGMASGTVLTIARTGSGSGLSGPVAIAQSWLGGATTSPLDGTSSRGYTGITAGAWSGNVISGMTGSSDLVVASAFGDANTGTVTVDTPNTGWTGGPIASQASSVGGVVTSVSAMNVSSTPNPSPWATWGSGAPTGTAVAALAFLAAGPAAPVAPPAFPVFLPRNLGPKSVGPTFFARWPQPQPVTTGYVPQNYTQPLTGGLIANGLFGPNVIGKLFTAALRAAGSLVSGHITIMILFANLVFGKASGYLTTILGDNPQLYWRFDESTGTVARDASGHSRPGMYTGTVTLNQTPGALTISGDTDAAVSVVGDTGYVVSSYNPFVIGASQMFEGWAKLTGTLGTPQGQSLFGGSTGPSMPCLFLGDGTSIGWYPQNSAGVIWSYTFPSNTWVYWALTWNDSTKVAELFINGVSQGTLTCTQGYLAGGSATNLLSTAGWPGFESGVTGMLNDFGTVTQSTAQAHSGSDSALVTASASGSLDLYANTGYPWDSLVTAGNEYTFAFWSLAATTPRSVHASFSWYDSSHTFISSDNGTAVTNSTSEWNQSFVNSIAPVGATAVLCTVQIDSVGAGEQHYIDDGSLTNVSGTGTYEAGSSDGSGGPFPGLIDEYAVYNSILTATQIAAHYTAGTIPSTSGFIRTTHKTVTGVLSAAGAMARRIAKGVTGTLKFTGSLLRSIAHTLVGSLIVAGVLNASKFFTKILSAALVGRGTLSKQIGKGITGSLTATGTIPKTISRVRVLVATLAITGSMTKTVARILVGFLISTGSLTKQTAHTLSASLQGVGAFITSAVHHYLQLLTGNLIASGSLTKFTSHLMNGTLTMTGLLQRFMRKVVSGALLVGGSVSKFVARILNASLLTTGIINKQISKRLVANLAMAATIAGKSVHNIFMTANLVAGGSLVRLISHLMNAALMMSGLTQRAISKSLVGTLSAIGIVNKMISHFITGALRAGGGVNKQTIRQLITSLITAGSIVGKSVHNVLMVANLVARGAISRLISHVMAAVLVMSSTMTRFIVHSLQATLAMTGVMTRTTRHTLSGALSMAGSLLRGSAHFLSLAGNLIVNGVLSSTATQIIQQLLTGALRAGGQLTRSTNKIVSGSIVVAGFITRQIRKVIIGSLAMAGAIQRRTNKLLVGAFSLLGSMFTGSHQLFNVVLNAALVTSASINKRIGKLMSASLSWVGNVLGGLIGKRRPSVTPPPTTQYRGLGRRFVASPIVPEPVVRAAQRVWRGLGSRSTPQTPEVPEDETTPETKHRGFGPR